MIHEISDTQIMVCIFSVFPQCADEKFIFKQSHLLARVFILCGFSHKVSISLAQTHRGQASPAPLGSTVPLPYMYTWFGYVNFDMWVSISPIFTMGFIRP